MTETSSDQTSPAPSSRPQPPRRRLADLAKRLEQTKVDLVTVIVFIGVLALMSGLAALIGYATHAMARK